jgi:nitrite reductase/ring-hydroxylating ferredoxin subunit
LLVDVLRDVRRVLSALSPSSALTGSASLTLGASGSGFVAGAVLQFNGAAVATTLVSSAELSATLPATALTKAGSYPVVVVNPAPGGGSSGALPFVVADPNPLPSISGLSPASVAAGSGPVTLTVTGTGFLPSTTAAFDGSARPATYASATQLALSLGGSDTLTAGSYPVTVANPAPGGGQSSAYTFTVIAQNPAPVLSSLSPASATAGSAGFTLTVNGSGFFSSSAVLVGGVARTTTFVSSGQLTAAVASSDLATAGSLSVSVSNPAPGGGVSGSLTLTVDNPLPLLASISPASVTVGSGAFTLSASGASFVQGAVVQVDGSARTTHFVSASQITADLLAGDDAATGTHTITVVNPAPGGGASSGVTLTITDPPNPVPAISGLSPSSVAAGSGAASVTLTGTGFVASSVAAFNGGARTTGFVSSTQLTASLTASDTQTAGAYPITVTNPAPGGGQSGAYTFTVVAQNPAPVLSSLSPSSATAGSAGVTLTANGSGFVSGSAIVWNGVTKSTTLVSATQLTAALSSADLAAAGSFSVTVTTPAPGGGSSATLAFIVNNPTPVLSSISPSTVTVGSGAFSLTVSGSAFAQGAVVQVDGSARTTHFVSASQITADLLSSDDAATGTHTINVVNPAPGGGTSAGATLTVSSQPNPAPAISGLSPASVAAGSGAASLTITGTGFVSSSVAAFNGSARTTAFVSSTQLTASLTAADTQTAGSYPITVTSPSPGGGTSSAYTFTVVAQNPAPVLTSLSPASAAAGNAGLTLTANGSGFISGSALSFNGLAKTTTFVSGTQLAAPLSAADLASAGSFPVVVTTPAPGGGASATLTFTVNNPAPVLSSISPSTVTVGSGAFSLAATGSSFVQGSVVQVDGSARTTHFVNSTQITADLLAGDDSATGTHTITVFNPTPGGGTSGGTTLTVASQPNPVPVLSTLSPCGKVAGAPAKQGLGSYPARFEATSGDVIIDLAAGDADMPPYQDGAVVFPLSLYPALAQAGGSVVGVPQGLGRAILVLARPGGGYSAMDATCTHLACLVEWSAQDGRVECPCHGSAFDETGAKIIGPAPTSLKGYAAALVDGSVRVSIPA